MIISTQWHSVLCDELIDLPLKPMEEDRLIISVRNEHPKESS